MEETKGLADYLKKIGYYNDDVFAMKLDKTENGVYILDMVVSDLIMNNDHLSENYIMDADDISFLVFHNAKAIINLCNFNFETVKTSAQN